MMLRAPGVETSVTSILELRTGSVVAWPLRCPDTMSAWASSEGFLRLVWAWGEGTGPASDAALARVLIHSTVPEHAPGRTTTPRATAAAPVRRLICVVAQHIASGRNA